MESTISLLASASASSLTLFTISKALNRHLTPKQPLFFPARRLPSIPSRSAIHFPSASPPLRSLSAVLPPIRRRLECVPSSAASYGTTAGGGGGGGGGEFGGEGGGGGDGFDGGDAKSNLAAGGAAEEVAAMSSDIIMLDVGGMTCGGCAASVKRILESQPQVSSASVNLTTETAIVWPVSEAKVAPNWQKQLGEALAKHLTSCGFTSNLRVAGQEAIEGDTSP